VGIGDLVFQPGMVGRRLETERGAAWPVAFLREGIVGFGVGLGKQGELSLGVGLDAFPSVPDFDKLCAFVRGSFAARCASSGLLVLPQPAAP
jgi:hypothetical protein